VIRNLPVNAVRVVSLDYFDFIVAESAPTDRFIVPELAAMRVEHMLIKKILYIADPNTVTDVFIEEVETNPTEDEQGP
jgi:hypothetical protein